LSIALLTLLVLASMFYLVERIAEEDSDDND
jgi:hypothetical protein